MFEGFKHNKSLFKLWLIHYQVPYFILFGLGIFLHDFLWLPYKFGRSYDWITCFDILYGSTTTSTVSVRLSLPNFIIKPMCVASLTLIFMRSVCTLQPMTPFGRVGSKFYWPSEDQCQRSHSKWVFVFIPCLKSKHRQSILSKLSRKSGICPWWWPWLLQAVK